MFNTHHHIWYNHWSTIMNTNPFNHYQTMAVVALLVDYVLYNILMTAGYLPFTNWKQMSFKVPVQHFMWFIYIQHSHQPIMNIISYNDFDLSAVLRLIVIQMPVVNKKWTVPFKLAHISSLIIKSPFFRVIMGTAPSWPIMTKSPVLIFVTCR